MDFMSAAGKLSRLFWENKTVLVTGHAGFKGTWLVLWLLQLGARVIGYGKLPQTDSTLYALIKSDFRVTHIEGDIRDLVTLLTTVKTYQPDIVIHMAAQPLVLSSYQNPVETYAINVMGTVNILDTLRQVPCAKAFINITTDKCYENKESDSGYQEFDKLGGFDPYSNSKACSELVTSAYYNSFFAAKKIGIATARSGNVIGGGDWAVNRLIPDIIRGCMAHTQIIIRHPDSIRPWQHVLDALHGICRKH
jgi:CDP-glucose 4,6-dehydratase